MNFKNKGITKEQMTGFLDQLTQDINEIESFFFSINSKSNDAQSLLDEMRIQKNKIDSTRELVENAYR